MVDHVASRQARIADLKRKLKARTGNPAHTLNCIAIQDQITHLEGIQAAVALASEEIGE